MEDEIIPYSIGICAASVCAVNTKSVEEVTEFLNLNHPTGISTNWTFDKEEAFHDGTNNPCKCDQESETRTHYLFKC